MKVAILSRYQKSVNRGAETVAFELTKRLSKDIGVDLLTGEDSDNFQKIIKGRYDIVMPLNGRMQSLKASLGRLIGGYKLVICGQSGIGRDDIFNIVVAKPDIFIAITDYMAKWAKKWAWGSRVVKINNGVDLGKFTPQGKRINLDLPRPIILSVGALTWYKHHEKVIEAVANLKKGSLLIVGKGEDESQLNKLAQQKLTGRFKIMQFAYEDMPKIYRSTDLFTLPSWDRESFGVVYLEAMASGLAVVAPNDSPRREIIGQAGIFVDPSNTQLYSQAIDQALKNRWNNKPREQAKKFSWDKVAKEYLSCFKNL